MKNLTAENNEKIGREMCLKMRYLFKNDKSGKQNWLKRENE
jgi:hypothetical protein